MACQVVADVQTAMTIVEAAMALSASAPAPPLMATVAAALTKIGALPAALAAPRLIRIVV